MVFIGDCGYPTSKDDSDVVTILSHTEGPWMEGNNITYSCTSDLMVTKINTSICMDNGQWEPDPTNITCTGNYCNKIIMSSYSKVNRPY